MKAIDIEIPNWGKFNPRSDRANYSWFRMENDFFDDQRVFLLSADQQRLYLFCLCQASKKNEGKISLLPEYIGGILRATPQDVEADLAAIAATGLLLIEIAVITPSSCRQDDGNVPALRPATRRDDTRRYETNETFDAGAAVVPAAAKSAGSLVWDAYAEAFGSRYGEAPVRNAKQNALCKQLAARLPENEAPEVARHYLSLAGFYAQRGHPLGMLVHDCEKIRTEWKTGKAIAPDRPKTFSEIKSDANAEMFRRVEAGEI